MMIETEIVLSEAEQQSRNQGQRPTCLAFVISDLNRRTAPGILSPEYIYRAAARQIPLWAPGDGLVLSAAMDASKLGQPEEIQFPYQADEPSVPIPSLPTDLDLFGSALKIYPGTSDFIIDSIRAGTPLGVVLRLTQEFYSPVDGVVAYSSRVLPNVQHAVLAVGVGKEGATDTMHAFIRNSWGSAWGINGCAWLPHQFLTRHAICSFGT